VTREISIVCLVIRLYENKGPLKIDRTQNLSHKELIICLTLLAVVVVAESADSNLRKFSHIPYVKI